MDTRDTLAEYREKRDFRSTPEPSDRQRPDPSLDHPTFVVQKHDASTLHYDFRLEVDGVLKSWAVRKGPSADPREKRLAMPTEDHPMAYATFEGVIPSGYGAGTVIVWDQGTYRNLREEEGVSMEQALAEGKVTFWLDGEKLRGGYSLVYMKGRGGWLLIKQDDDEADSARDLVSEAPASVLTGRTIEEVSAEAGLPPKAQKPGGRKRTTPSQKKPRAPKRTPKEEGERKEIRVGRRTVEVSSPDKVLFPESGLTKGDLVDYYRRVAEWMVPYLKDRPLTLHRFPDGIDHAGFVQQHAPDYYPDWIARATVEKEEGGTVTHAVASDAASLVYLANQNVITPHVWLSRVDRPRHPDRLIFDLDPPGGDFDAVRRAAFAVRELLEELGLPAFVMATGSKGLHVVTPLDRRADFDAVRDFVRDASEVLAQRYPADLTVEQRKAKREGRVFLDPLRNTYAHTAVAPYAVRAKPGAPVATPLDWDEVKDPKMQPGRYTIENLFRRLARKEDPWAGMGRRACGLTAARRRLDALRQEAR